MTVRQALCYLAGCGLSLSAGVYFAQQIKDWLKGVPAHARAEIAKLEAEVIERAKKGF